jgi:hypothetical protein
MLKKLAFDSLQYAKQGGVEHAAIHSSALADAIVQNIYTKDETDKMIENALKEFEERTHRMQLEMKDLRLEIEKSANRTVAILGL